MSLLKLHLVNRKYGSKRDIVLIYFGLMLFFTTLLLTKKKDWGRRAKKL